MHFTPLSTIIHSLLVYMRACEYLVPKDLQYLAAPVASKRIMSLDDCLSFTSPAFRAASLTIDFALSFQIAGTVRIHLIAFGLTVPLKSIKYGCIQ